MKYLKNYTLFESRAERVYNSDVEKYNRLSDDEKQIYSAEYILNLISKKYPKEKFEIVDYYNKKAKVAFISDNSSLLNVWNRDSNRYDDGLNKEFAKFLKSNGLTWSWRSDNGSWDGITIYPKDFTNFHFYYGINNPPKKKNVIISDDFQELIDDSIYEFNKKGLQFKLIDDYEGGGEDRVTIETNIEGMIVHVDMFPEKRNGIVSSQVEEKLNKINQSMERHFTLVKEVWDYCEYIAEGPLWTMCGGGAQLQQFYGDDNGYLCILYLDMEDKKGNKDWDYNEKYILTVNGNKNDIKFNDFNSDKIKLLKNREIYGDED